MYHSMSDYYQVFGLKCHDGTDNYEWIYTGKKVWLTHEDKSNINKNLNDKKITDLKGDIWSANKVEFMPTGKKNQIISSHGPNRFDFGYGTTNCGNRLKTLHEYSKRYRAKRLKKVNCYCFECYGREIRNLQSRLIHDHHHDYCLCCGVKCHKVTNDKCSVIYPPDQDVSKCDTCQCIICITSKVPDWSQKLVGHGCFNNKRALIDQWVDTIPAPVKFYIKSILYNTHLKCSRCRDGIMRFGNCFTCNQRHHYGVSTGKCCSTPCVECTCLVCLKKKMDHKCFKEAILKVNPSVSVELLESMIAKNRVRIISMTPAMFLSKANSTSNTIVKEITELIPIDGRCEHPQCRGRCGTGRLLSFSLEGNIYQCKVC